MRYLYRENREVEEPNGFVRLIQDTLKIRRRVQCYSTGNMNLSSFQELRSHLHGVQTMYARGKTRIEGSFLVEGADDSVRIYPETGNTVPGGTPVLSTEEDPAFAISPSMVHVHTTETDAYRLSLQTGQPESVSVEGSFNDWGTVRDQSWSMDLASGGEREIFVDISGHKDGFLYRFVVGRKIHLDPKIKTVSFLPCVGVCNRAEPGDRYPIHIGISLNKPWPSQGKKHRKKHANFRIVSYPSWLIPEAKKIRVQKGLPVAMACTLHLTRGLALKNEGKVVFQDITHRDRKVELPVELTIAPPGIFLELKQKEITLDRRVARGEIIELMIPFVTRGSGTVHLVFFGNGVAQENQLTAEPPALKEHEVHLRLDTANMSPLQARNVKVHVRSDAKLANKRHFEIAVHLNLVRLRPFPVLRLDWPELSWGSQPTQFIEFFQSDTSEPVQHVEAEIPDKLAGILRADSWANRPHGVRFVLDSAQLNWDERFEEEIPIKASSTDGLWLTGTLPVKIGVVSTDSSIGLHYKKWYGSRDGDGVTLVFKNDGPHPMEIFCIHWEKGRFLCRKSIREEGQSDWPMILAGQELELVFVPRKRAGWFLPRSISDVVTIKCNSRNTPRFSQEVRLMLTPKILSAFFFLCQGPKRFRFE